MTTGDNKATAEAISRQLGILNPDSEVGVKSITGKEFEDMSDSQSALDGFWNFQRHVETTLAYVTWIYLGTPGR